MASERQNPFAGRYTRSSRESHYRGHPTSNTLPALSNDLHLALVMPRFLYRLIIPGAKDRFEPPTRAASHSPFLMALYASSNAYKLEEHAVFTVQLGPIPNTFVKRNFLLMECPLLSFFLPVIPNQYEIRFAKND